MAHSEVVSTRSVCAKFNNCDRQNTKSLLAEPILIEKKVTELKTKQKTKTETKTRQKQKQKHKTKQNKNKNKKTKQIQASQSETSLSTF